MMLLPLLLGTALATEAILIDRALPEPTESRGKWRALPSGVHLSEPAPGSMNVLIPAGPDLTDSLTRATVRLGRNPHITVLVRVTYPEGELEALSGIGLSLRGDHLQWERWDRGVGHPVAPEVRPSTPLSGKAVSLEIQAQGSSFVAIVRDPAGHGELARAEISDDRWTWGRTAIRLQDDAFTTVERLSVEGRPLEQGAPRPSGNPGAPIGTERFVLVRNVDLARLPPGMRTKVLGTWPFDKTQRQGLLLSIPELKALQQSGVPHELRPHVPFWARDADLRGPRRDERWTGGRPDPNAPYRDSREVERLLRQWARLHPERAQAFAIGQSHQDRPLVAMRLTEHPQPDTLPAVLLLAGLHGGDLLTTEYALDAITELLTGPEQVQALLREVDLWVVPLANPDGHDTLIQISEHAGRKNGRDTDGDGVAGPFEGVDLNRNFPMGWGRSEQASRSFAGSPTYRGPGPTSEPETQALLQLAQQRHFVAALIFNASGNIMVPPYSLTGVPNPEPNVARMIAEELVNELPGRPYNQSMRVRKLIHQVDGAAQDWLRFSFGTVALSVQGPAHNPTDRKGRLDAIRELRPIVPALLRRVASGPRLSGVVVNREGAPVRAAVSTNLERCQASERWSSREIDGRFHRLLPTGGDALITVRAEGYRPASTRVTVDGVSQIRVVLDPRP